MEHDKARMDYLAEKTALLVIKYLAEAMDRGR